MPPLSFKIGDLHAAYAAGLAPDMVIDTALQRLRAAADPGIFLHLESRDAMRAAAASLGPFDPSARPLWGVRFAVKDNIDVAGVPTTAACPAFAYVPEADAPAVALIKGAGAIFVGKTNLDQFATGLVGVRTPYPVPRNALDERLVPGGSSSGSAVATARGIVSFALGSDTAGSGRVPAALNGIVGLKPSLGAISTRGMVPACRTLDCVSIFAGNVADAWRVLSVAAGYDRADPYSRRRDVLTSPAAGSAPEVGVPSAATIRFFGDGLQEAVFAETVLQLQAQGIRCREIDFGPLFAVADMLYEGAWVAERLAAVADFMAHHHDALHPVTRTIIGGAGRLSAVDAFNGFYRLQGLKREVEALLDGIDLLMVPTVPTVCTLADLAADPIGPNARLGTYTNFVNLLDMCGIAVPAGRRADGLPGSVTLLARGGQDRLAAEVAQRLEANGSSLTTGRPAVAPRAAAAPGAAAADAARPDRLEIAVVGAHLSGMALNHELTALDGRLVRRTETAAEYSLFALPGAGPARPGLLRVGESDGAAIEIEVWSLAPAAFAAFVAAIRAPLGIGTVRLADGTAVQGFLVEAIAVKGAQNITRFGGWRRYVASLAHTAAS